MTQSIGTITWRRGTLLPYESMPSLGAKYCWYNAIHAEGFIELLAEFMPALAIVRSKAIPRRDQRPTCAVDAPGFRLAAFATFLGEPSHVLQSQSLMGMHVSAQKEWEHTLNPKPPFWTLRVCARCMTLGYHSVVHETRVMERCFIHLDEPLVEMPRVWCALPKEFSTDTRHIGTLHEAWFGDRATHPRHQARASLTAEELAQAGRSVAKLRDMLSRSSSAQNAQAVAVNLSLKEEGIERSQVLPPSLQRSVGRWGHRALMGSKWASANTLEFSLPPGVAVLVSELNEGWLSYLCAARLIEGRRSSEPPGWLSVAIAGGRAMLFRHGECIRSVARVLGKPAHAVALNAVIARRASREPSLDRSPALFEEKLLVRNVLPCMRMMSDRWWREFFLPGGEAFVDCVDALTQGRLAPFTPRQIALVLSPMLKAGLCRRTRLHQEEGDLSYFGVSGLGLGGAWQTAFGVPPRESGIRSSNAIPDGGHVFAPSGVMAQVIDQILSFSVWTLLWLIREVEQELEQSSRQEGHESILRPIARFLERLKEQAPFTYISVSRTRLTASTFCRYPSRHPRFDREPGHTKRVAAAVEKLEEALSDFGAHRRAMVNDLRHNASRTSFQ